MKDLYKYVYINYGATGEGVTIFGLITRAYPYWNEEGIKVEDRDIIALSEMERRVGKYFSTGSEILEKDEFIENMGTLMPEWVIEMINKKNNEIPGNFIWFTEVHFNYS